MTRGATPRVAVVQLRKYGHWVLPKGKLGKNESPLAAARREVLEETGHRVSVHEFLGVLCYESNQGAKIVQFWRMRALDGPPRELMADVKAVQWLPIAAAIAKLTHRREQIFLRGVAARVVQASTQRGRKTLVRQALKLLKAPGSLLRSAGQRARRR